MRLAIVGAGGIARAHAEAIHGMSDCALVAVADTDPAAARRLAEPAGARVHASVGELLAAGGFDAAIVCTPPATHEEVVVALVAAGIATLCEKPFAPTPAAARRMADAASATGTLLTLASKFRFSAGVAACKRLLDAGELGEVTLVENVFTTRLDMAERWHADPLVSGGGVIMDNAPHVVDLVRHLFGELEAVCAVELAPRRLAVEESAILALRTRGGLSATSLLSWHADTRRPWYLAVHGTAGSVEVGWAETRARINGGDWRRIAAGYAKADCFAALLRDFVGAARGEHPPAVTADDALAAVEAVDASHRSLNRSSWCEVRPACEASHA